MKAILENHVKTLNPEVLKNFIFFLSVVSCSKNEKDLRQGLKHFELNSFFKMGFGSNHLWLSDSQTGDRILFVEFKNEN